MTTEAIITDNGETSDPEDARQAAFEEQRETIRRQQIAIDALRTRLIEVEMELINTRCELIIRDNAG